MPRAKAAVGAGRRPGAAFRNVADSVPAPRGAGNEGAPALDSRLVFRLTVCLLAVSASTVWLTDHVTPTTHFALSTVTTRPGFEPLSQRDGKTAISDTGS